MENSKISTIYELLNESERLAQECDEKSLFDSNYYNGKAQAFREVLAVLGYFE